MSQAKLCPVCNGKGKIKKIEGWNRSETKTCHGCGGKGWVEVSDPYRPWIKPTKVTP